MTADQVTGRGSRRSFFRRLSLLAAAWPIVRLQTVYGRSQHQVDSQLQATKRPTWCRDGIVAAWVLLGNYPSQRMWGDLPVDYERSWMKDVDEAAIKHYKEIGINLIVVILHNGAGLKAEAETIEAGRKATEIAHRYGIKVAGYIGFTLFPETLYLEEPEAHTWEQVDERGRPIYYNDQFTFRRVACRNNPGYRGFIQKVVRLGIQDLKLDMIHCDHLNWWAAPWACHCQFCQEGLRAYLRKKYTDAQLKSRLGFTHLEGIRVLDFNQDAPPVRAPGELTNPLIQEWAQFRCASLAEWWAETSAYVRKLNPQVALLGNPELFCEANVGFQWGTNLEQLFPSCDYLWSEEGNEPLWTLDGRLISRIRTYKVAREMGRSLFLWQRTAGLKGDYEPPFAEGPLTLGVAESLAYNDANLGVWQKFAETLRPFDREEQPPRKYLEYIRFFHSHIQDLRNTRVVTDVAVLRSFISMEFNPTKSIPSTMLFEQVLIQRKIPFGIIFDAHLKDLNKYKVLVLANQDALSEEQMDAIRRFVAKGGGLVATEESSMRTEWRRKRSSFGLADLFGIERPPDQEEARNILRRNYGQGRVVYIPRIEPDGALPPAMLSYRFSHDYWKLPVNYEELVQAVQWAGGEVFSANVDAPMWVTMELAEQESTGTRLLHLLNFRYEEGLHDIPVQVRIPKGFRLREAAFDSPDGLSPRILDVTGREGMVSFSVPELRMYDLIVLRTQET